MQLSHDPYHKSTGIARQRRVFGNNKPKTQTQEPNAWKGAPETYPYYVADGGMCYDGGGPAREQHVDLGKKGSFSINKGGLHRALGIPEDEKIGAARTEKALHSSKPRVRRMAASAKGFAAMKS
jgi:hypothetical protein